METVLIGLILGIASGLAKDGGLAVMRGAFTLPPNVLQLAIRATASRFADIEGTEVALREWTSGEAFTHFFHRVYTGERDFDQEVIASFVEDGDFYLLPEEECFSIAEKIVLDFLQELLDGIYRSADGVPVLAMRQEVLHQQTRSEIVSSQEASFADLNAKLESLHSLIADTSNQPGQTEQEAAHELENIELTENIDFARKLMERGLIQAARAELERLCAQDGPMPEELRFRILTNLAGCELADQNSARARALLEEAHRLQPENPKGIANAALAAQLGKDSKRAIELAHKARASNSQDSQATAVLITQLWERGDSIEFEKLVSKEGWIATDRQCVLALISIRVQQLRFEEAETLCQSLIEKDPDDAVGFLTLSQCLLNCIQTSRFSGGYTTDSIAKLRKAEGAAARALEILEDTELKAQRRGALMARAGARMILGMDTDAMSDLDAILREEPENSDATLHMGLLHLYCGRFEEAAALLESVQSSAGDENAVLPLAEALLPLGQSEGAAKLLENTIEFDSAEWDDVLRGEVLTRAELGCKREDSVGPKLVSALGDHPEDARLLTLSALRASIYGSVVEAERAFAQALDSADDADRREVLLRFGSFYEGLERFSEAAERYEEVVAGEPCHPAAIPLLLCLVRSKRYREALSWVRRIRQDSSHSPRIAVDVEAMILEHVGDVRASLLLFQEICCRSDATDFDRLNLAATQFRHSNREAARSTVARVRSASLTQDPRSILKLAQLKILLDVPGHIEDAFVARRWGINDPSVHLGYFTMFAAREREWLEPEVIGPGSAALLKSGPFEQWWQILDVNEFSRGPYEIPSNGDLAQALLGKSVGETIEIRRDIEELSYEVVAVQSKFVRAYQETCDEFSTRFPGNRSLSRVSVEGEDFTKVFETVDARHQFANEAERIYREGRLPFASFASLLGLSAPELWFACTQSSVTPIRFGVGTEEDEGNSDALLAETDGIVLDLTSLLTVYRLNLAGHLRNRYSSVAIPQGVIDELQRAYALRVMGPSSTGSLGKLDGGGYALFEVSSDAEASLLEFLRSALEFAESFDRIPSYALLDVDNADELVDALTASGVGAVYAGEESSTLMRVLVSDDIVLSTYARSIGVDAVNSQGLLKELLRSSTITADDYSSAIEYLSLLHYWFVQVGSEDLIRRFEATGWVSSNGTRAMLSTLEGPDCSQESALSVAANVIASAAGRASDVQFQFVLWLVLASLKQGRSANSVLSQFKSKVNSMLTLAPQMRDQVLEIVDISIAFAASK